MHGCLIQRPQGSRAGQQSPNVDPPDADIAPVPIIAHFPFEFASDTMRGPRASTLALAENGTSLGPPYSLHADIRADDNGRYCAGTAIFVSRRATTASREQTAGFMSKAGSCSCGCSPWTGAALGWR